MVSTLVGTKGLCYVYLMPCDHSIPLAPCRRDIKLTESSYIERLPLQLLFIFCLALAAGQSIAAETDAPSTALTQALGLISSDRMLADIRTLSGPEFNGRQTGTPDDLASSEFVRQRFMDLRKHRSPVSESRAVPDRLQDQTWIQSAPIRTTTIGNDPRLHAALTSDAHPALIGTDYLPVLDSPSADLESSIVFVGYGISDPTGGFDEYAGLDVRNKVVLFLRGKPERYAKQVSHADKVHMAHAHGAIGYLTATGPILNAYETRRGVTGRPSAFYGLTDTHRTIPGAWISTALASAILSAQQPGEDNRLRRLQQQLNDTMAPQSMTTDVSIRMRWHSMQRNGTLQNVVALLPGQDGAHQHDAILIGAHRDHFGKQGGLLFAGADDNASGTAVILEVARVLTSMPVGPKRSIIVVSFSGEEQGLLGSKLYVTQPMVPLTATAAMINVDHAAVGNGRLTIGVTGLEKPAAQQAGERAGLADRIDLFGFFPGGDHVPFKEAGVPTVTVVSGGIHPHFHQPTDTVDTVNADILSAAARYVLAIAWQLADAP
uniref:Putative peptidase n=1 Tax=uncultured bacterium pBE3-1 TaxID=1781161 RepID=A0A1C9U529_9BACT|nr:putative peptidase [uncultured bacterium pBE3-1]